MLQQDHPPVLIPVYLADAAQDPPDWSFLPDDAGVYLSTAGGEFPLPFPMIDNPLMLDWLLGRLTQYMDGAQLRLHVQSEAEAVQEVLNAYYNYLTAPKLRTPVPEALTPSQAYTLLETAQSLVRLHVQGEGTHWLHLVQNHAAPAIFARDKPDLMVGVGSTVSSGIWTQNYLSPQGRSAVLMPRPDAESGSSGRRFVDLEAVLPGAALLVSGPEQRASVQFTGGPIPPGSSWAEARSGVRITGGPPPAPP
ncbi:MAG: hypothetical protein BZY83_05735 [SAR202 cluster bacterium Casp-Chloro-G2]|nr:MAG: hypothetical protein BZY83_05735 [SAR202 cluster bacterium Casp-Chloro-G2]